MPKMGSHCSFEHLKHKLWPKEGAGSRIASLTPNQKKSGIDPIYLAADNMPHTVRKLSTRAITLLQIALRLLAKLWGSKVPRIPTGKISGLPHGSPAVVPGVLGVSGEKSHLDVGPVESYRIYYKGEGDGFPKVWAMVSLVCPCCPWFVLAPKVLQLCTNHFVWVVCRPVGMNKLVNSS